MRKITILSIAIMTFLLFLQIVSAEGDIVGSGTCGSCKWSVDAGGELVIEPISGEEGTLAEWEDSPPWLLTQSYPPGTDFYRDSNILYRHFTSVKIVGNIKAVTCKSMFKYVGARAEVLFTGLDNLDTSDVKDMSEMFMSVRSKNGWEFLKSFDTSKVVTMEDMFWNSTVDLHQVEAWDVSSVENMSCMFCSVDIEKEEDTTIDLTKWDVSSVTVMDSMFEGYGFEDIWVDSRVTPTLTINLSNWNTSKVIDMSLMFWVCHATDICVDGWDTSEVTNMRLMFCENPRLRTLDLSSFDTSKVTDFQEFFYNCRPLRLVTGEKFKDDKHLYFSEFNDGYYEYLNDPENGEYHEPGSLMPRGSAVYACSAVVSFDPNGGDGEMSSQAFGWSLSDKALKKNTFTKDNHIFTGWNTEPDGSGKSYADVSELGFDDFVSENQPVFWSNYNITLYAQWETSFTVTYTDGAEGKVFDDQVYEVEKGSKTPAFIGTPSREGYIFKGWEPGVIETVNEDAVYTAQWEKNNEEPSEDIYTIVFDPNGGKIDGSTGAVSSEHRNGETIKIIDAPERDGYTFLYWKGSEYLPGDSYTVTEDHTFTAQWKKNEEDKNPDDTIDVPEDDNTPSDKTPPDSSSPGKSHGKVRTNNSPKT